MKRARLSVVIPGLINVEFLEGGLPVLLFKGIESIQVWHDDVSIAYSAMKSAE